MTPTSLKLNIFSPYGKHLIFPIFLVEIKLKWLFGLAKPFNLYVLQVKDSVGLFLTYFSHTFQNSLFQNLVKSPKIFPPTPELHAKIRKQYFFSCTKVSWME